MLPSLLVNSVLFVVFFSLFFFIVGTVTVGGDAAEDVCAIVIVVVVPCPLALPCVVGIVVGVGGVVVVVIVDFNVTAADAIFLSLSLSSVVWILLLGLISSSGVIIWYTGRVFGMKNDKT